MEAGRERARERKCVCAVVGVSMGIKLVSMVLPRAPRPTIKIHGGPGDNLDFTNSLWLCMDAPRIHDSHNRNENRDQRGPRVSEMLSLGVPRVNIDFESALGSQKSCKDPLTTLEYHSNRL